MEVGEGTEIGAWELRCASVQTTLLAVDSAEKNKFGSEPEETQESEWFACSTSSLGSGMMPVGSICSGCLKRGVGRITHGGGERGVRNEALSRQASFVLFEISITNFKQFQLTGFS